MPCLDNGGPVENEKAYLEVKQKLDKVTDFLCKLCKKAEGSCDVDLSEISGLTAWWSSHKLDDEKRRQKLIKQALAKLTPDEREALGHK